MVEQGRVILNFVDIMVSRTCQRAVPRKFCGYNAMVVNCSNWVSEIGNALSSREDCQLAVIWSFDHKTNSCNVSLRSSSDSVDVSVVAKKYGGGGHPKASGGSLFQKIN